MQAAHDSARPRVDAQVLAFDPMRGRPCSIVHVVSPGAIGGLETVVYALARGHAEVGHHVTVVSVADDEASCRFLDRFAGSDVQTMSLGAGGRVYLGERIAACSAFARIRPDVVHTHGLRPDVIDAGAARSIGIATATTVHGYTDSTLRNQVYGFVQRMCLRSFDAVVAVSTPLARVLASYVEPSRLHVIPNGFMPSASPADRLIARSRLGVHDGRLLIGWVGRLSPEKGPDVALRALARLVQGTHPGPLELAVLGNGPERPNLERLARQYGVESLVHWHGTRSDAPLLMAAFDVFVLSSRTEGTPMVLLEAMFAKTPIIATRVGGVPDMLTAEEALLVPSNDPDALASAIRSVLTNHDAASVRALKAADVLATRYDGRAWLDQYAALYGQLRVLTLRRQQC